MIRIFIVEDKPPILRNIKQKIECFSPEIEVVGEAINGQLALPLIKGLKPDILFTDIRMPVMDGLQLINELKNLGIDNIQYVIISGYDEFEYARQALKLGVSEYLLKPVTQEAINEVLIKLTAHVRVQKEMYEKSLLSDIINLGSSYHIPSNCDFGCRYYIPILLCVGPYPVFIIDYTNPYNTFWPNVNISSILEKHIPSTEKLWILEGNSSSELLFLIGLSENGKFDITQFSDALFNELKTFDTPVTLTVGQTLKNISDLGIEVQLTRAILQKNLVFAKSGVFYRDKLSLTSAQENCLLDAIVEKKLDALIRGRQRNLFYKELEELFHHWEKGGFTQNAIEKLLKQIARLFMKIFINQRGFYNDKELEIDEIVSTSKDYTALLKGLKFVFDPFFTAGNNPKHKGDSIRIVIEKIEEYLINHYSEQITINEIAEMVELDPAYLSRAFKNLKGISPMEYLTNLRIEKAKELLTGSSKLTLKEISEILGYSDSYYFSRVFKIVTGLSPSDFKNSLTGTTSV